MVAAAVEGAIDFRDADPADKQWWLRLRLTLDHLARRDVARQHGLHYDYALALLSRGQLPAKAHAMLVEAADGHLAEIGRLLRPWERVEAVVAARDAQLAEMAMMWDREFGDRNLPEVQAAIAETGRTLEKMAERARTPRDAPTVR